MKTQSRTKGIAISYLTTIVRTLSRLILTPLYLKVLGIDGYGFYQYIFSVASYATILDFGISSVVNTFSIKHKEQGNTEGVENVMFYALMFSVGAALLIVLGGVIIIVEAPGIFGEVVLKNLALTRMLLAIITTELIILMFQHYFEGVILASEKYVTLKSVSLVQILIRSIVTVLLLYSNLGVLSIALGDCIGVIICLCFEIYYCRTKIGLKIRYRFYDPGLIRGIAKLSLALCLQSVVSYLNSSIDKYVLGRYLSTVAVTIYTVAVTFSVFFDEIPTVIQRLYLPQVVKLVESGADGEQLTDYVIRPGRYQFMLVGGVLGAFILFGRQFISMWSGAETAEAWQIALLLMVPSVLPLIQNVCLSILTAMNKRMFRSYVLCGIAIANLFLTVFLVEKIGIMGAPIGTFIALVLGNNIAMNWYYKKVIGINVGRLFKSILYKLLPCTMLATCVCGTLLFVPYSGVIWFVSECIIYCIVYAVFLWMIGMNNEERYWIRSKVERLIRRKNS